MVARVYVNVRWLDVRERAMFKLVVSPCLHLTTSKVMVIVWSLGGNIIRTVLYIANVLPLQWTQLTKTVHTVGPRV